MRISILVLTTLAAATTAMFLSFTVPSAGRQGYTGSIACAPELKVQPVQNTGSGMEPMQWFVDKNMSDNELTSNPGNFSTSGSPEVPRNDQRSLPELK